MDERKQQNTDIWPQVDQDVRDKNLLFDLNKEAQEKTTGEKWKGKNAERFNARVSAIGFILWAGLLARLSIIMRRSYTR